jgi:hypothetical protein
MTAPVRFKQDDVKRAVAGSVAGAVAAGLPVRGIHSEITPDGRIVVLLSSDVRQTAVTAANPWDDELRK